MENSGCFTKDDPRINRNGRPEGSKSFTTKVREALEKIAEGKNYTYEEAFIKTILKKSIVDGDTSMIRTVWEQLDGKPLQKVELGGRGDFSDIENAIKEISHGHENTKTSADDVQGRAGETAVVDTESSGDIQSNIQEALS